MEACVLWVLPPHADVLVRCVLRISEAAVELGLEVLGQDDHPSRPGSFPSFFVGEDPGLLVLGIAGVQHLPDVALDGPDGVLHGFQRRIRRVELLDQAFHIHDSLLYAIGAKGEPNHEENGEKPHGWLLTPFGTLCFGGR